MRVTRGIWATRSAYKQLDSIAGSVRPDAPVALHIKQMHPVKI